MSYEFISMGDNYMATLYDRVNNINTVSPEFIEAFKEVALHAVSKSYQIMFDTVIADTKEKIQALDPTKPDYKDELIKIKRAAKVDAEFIAGRLPQGQDYELCVMATSAVVNKLIDSAKKEAVK